MQYAMLIKTCMRRCGVVACRRLPCSRDRHRLIRLEDWGRHIRHPSYRSYLSKEIFMRVFSVVGAIGFLLAAPSAHAQVSGRVTSLQIGSDVLFGQEFSLNFCQPTMGADAQCLSDPGTKASSCRFRNDGQPTSHTCDSGSVVDCGQPHFLRKWIMNNMWPPLFPPNPFIYYAPRYRLDFANGWITEVNWVSCAANNVHQQTAWRYFNSFPQWTSPAEAAIQGFADHIRPAFARGTIV